MIIAAIGDVHANLPALEAVLEHANQLGAEALCNVGDFVGYGAFPEEVVKRLRKIEAISIQGNYDRKVLKVKQKRDEWKKEKIPEKWLAFKWAYDHLTKKSRKYLRSLPTECALTVEGHPILLVHGSPASQDEHLTLDTPIERLHELAEMNPAEIIVCGHSHQPFTRHVGDTWFINTGSVGRPDDGDPRAAYALLELTPGHLEVNHYRVDYDLQRAVRAILENSLPESFARMIQQGRSLDVVKPSSS
ncbi:MAG: metallophosphoesterase family protein [Anaerolineaceae bacterium]|nr:metallophosphoesterase family protein [Anaerolineaceae bacterium]